MEQGREWGEEWDLCFGRAEQEEVSLYVWHTSFSSPHHSVEVGNQENSLRSL